jgi:RNA polymerase sigma factor (TIGR02999 family)
MGEITDLLQQWSASDAPTIQRLTDLVYQDLRQAAARHLRRERPDAILQTTALVHDVFLKLRTLENVEWESRAHFFGVTARLMRQILVDHARKRAVRARPVDHGAAWSFGADLGRVSIDIVAVNVALDKLTAHSARLASLVELRFFGGLDSAEIAEITRSSLRTVERDWKFAKAWLQNELMG